MAKPKKSEIGKKEIETKQYSISYYLHGGHKIDVAACLTDEKLKMFVNTFSGNKKAAQWMQQLFQSGMYVINLSNVILVEIKDAVQNVVEEISPTIQEVLKTIQEEEPKKLEHIKEKTKRKKN